MEIIKSLDKIVKPFKNAVISIGNFDGVHIGHQALFHQVIEKAEAINGTSVAMTFEPHPLRVLKQNNLPPLITLYEQKTELIARSGIDVLICVPFTREFAALSAKEFVVDLLINRIGMSAIVVGEDYTFGRNREGNLELLQSMTGQHNFEVIRVDWVQIAKNYPGRISSTRARKLVMEGKVAEVQQLLGRHYQLRGLVTTGRDRGGKLLGFPTANINLHDELCPKTGVYAVTVECRGQHFQGVANIGYSPTFEDRMFTVEVHILDFNQNIYGQKIKINFVRRIRDEIKFASIEQLSEQIKQDVVEARNILI
jgi:riboflavin kinase/FMN adenylyltransferase